MNDPVSLLSFFLVLGRKMRVMVVPKMCATQSLTTAPIGGPPWVPMKKAMKTSTQPQGQWDCLEKVQRQSTHFSGWLVKWGLIPVPLSMIMNLCFHSRALYFISHLLMIWNMALCRTLSVSADRETFLSGQSLELVPFNSTVLGRSETWHLSGLG